MAGIGELSLLVVSVMALLLAIAADWVIHALARIIPDIKIPIVGWNPRKSFEGSVEPVFDWVVKASEGLWEWNGRVIQDIGYIFDRGFGEAANTIEHLGDQVDYLVGKMIPDTANEAIDGVVGFVEGEVETATDDVVAGAEQILADVSEAARVQYQNDFNSKKGLKTAIAAAASAAVGYAVGWADGKQKAAERHAKEALEAEALILKEQIRQLREDIQNALDAATHSTAATLLQAGQVLGGELAAVESEAAHAEQHAKEALGVLRETAHAVGAPHITELAEDLEHWIRRVESTADDARKQIAIAAGQQPARYKSEPGAIINDAIKAAQTTANLGVAEAEKALADLEAEARQIGVKNISDIGTTLSARINTAQTSANSALAEQATFAKQVGAPTFNTAGTVITGDFSAAAKANTAQLIGALTGTATEVERGHATTTVGLPGAEGALATAILAPVAALATTVAAIATRVGNLEGCAVYACEPGAHGYPKANQISNALEKLWEAGGLAAFTAWLATAIAEPVPTGRAFAASARGLKTDAERLMDDLLSI